VKEVIVEAPPTTKSVALLAVPLGVVTVILPVVAPVGTVAVICVELLNVNAVGTPLNFTLVTPVKFVPVTVTTVPTAPLVGVNDVIVGHVEGMVNVPLAAVPPPPAPAVVVTVIEPVVAPDGTVAVT
jgi:hypothetical protein